MAHLLIGAASGLGCSYDDKLAADSAECRKGIPKKLGNFAELGSNRAMVVIHEFGPFRLDSEAEILFRGADPVPLGRRAVALLRVLVERPGVPVSKDALIDAAWPGLAVEESNLSVQIAALRRMLGEQREGGHWIETLPRRGYRFIGPVASRSRDDGASAPSAVETASDGKGERGARPSVAVVPFDNLSRDAEIESFCDGLAEDVIMALSKFRWVNVVSRNSSFAHRGRSLDIRLVARELGVRYILEGSVRKSDRRIRVAAQLIDGISGNHVWAERYDRDYSAPFDLQDEITRDVVASLEYVLWIALIRGDGRVGVHDPESSPLRAAGSHIVECTHIGNRTAIAHAMKALNANPKSVAAYQYLANAYISDLMTGWTQDPAVDVENLLEAGRQATALSPADHLSQGLYGLALVFAGNHDDGLAWARRALALNRNSVNVLGPCGNVLSFLGEAAEANDMLERMLRLAPAHYFRAPFLSQMALNWSRLGEPERGLRLVGEALKLKPDAICCHATYAQLLATVGRDEAADAAISEALRRRPDLDRTLIGVMFPHRDQSIPNQLAAALTRVCKRSKV